MWETRYSFTVSSCCLDFTCFSDHSPLSSSPWPVLPNPPVFFSSLLGPCDYTEHTRKPPGSPLNHIHTTLHREERILGSSEFRRGCPWGAILLPTTHHIVDSSVQPTLPCLVKTYRCSIKSPLWLTGDLQLPLPSLRCPSRR